MHATTTVADPYFPTLVSVREIGLSVNPYLPDGTQHALNCWGCWRSPEGEDEYVGTVVDVEVDGPAELGGGGDGATIAILPYLTVLLGFRVIMAVHSMCRCPG